MSNRYAVLFRYSFNENRVMCVFDTRELAEQWIIERVYEDHKHRFFVELLEEKTNESAYSG
jgi:hypothetical protein